MIIELACPLNPGNFNIATHIPLGSELHREQITSPWALTLPSPLPLLQLQLSKLLVQLVHLLLLLLLLSLLGLLGPPLSPPLSSPLLGSSLLILLLLPLPSNLSSIDEL
ncbi:hypothetical protein GGI42DRAFT_321206 [Trichoderma sp. SZMC 28013]